VRALGVQPARVAGTRSTPSSRSFLVTSSRRARARRKALVRLRRGVYVLDPADDSRARAALHARPSAALCRQAAVWALTGGRVPLPPVVELVTPPGSQARHTGAHREQLSEAEVCQVAGLRVTAPLRTGLDVARYLPPSEALQCLDALTNTCCLSVEDLGAGIRALHRVRGAVQARRLIQDVEPRSESVRETWLRLQLVGAGLPRPRAQLKVTDRDGEFLAWADLGYERLRLVLEYLGRSAHMAYLERDAERVKLLGGEGWRVLPFTNRDFWQPERITAQIEEAARQQYAALRLTGPLWVPEWDAAESRVPRPRPGALAPFRAAVEAARPADPGRA